MGTWGMRAVHGAGSSSPPLRGATGDERTRGAAARWRRPARRPGRRPLRSAWLIGEVDRGETGSEASLWEWLAEAAVTIPEPGSRRALAPPVVVLTSNRTRDLHDALKRRCLYHWIDYPATSRVAAI